MIFRKLLYVLPGLALLVLTQGCGLALRSASGQLKGSGVWGLVKNGKGSPVAGARVYAYEIFTPEEESYEAGEIEALIKDELTDDTEGYYDEDRKPHYERFRGPADYISALTDAEGQYILRLPPGTYCLVARKRTAGIPDIGPLTPEDLSSLVSRPNKIKDKQTLNLDLTIRKLVGDVFFSSKYTLRASNTVLKGNIADEAGQPLARLLVVANRKPKISRKPDYASFPSEQDGNFILYLPGGGIYYLRLKNEALGEYLPAHIESSYINPADDSLEIFSGNSINGINIIRLKEEP